MSSTTTASAGKTPVAKPPSGTAPVDKAPPRLRGGLPFFGHMLPFAKNPYHFMQRAHDEGGEVVEFTMLGAKIVLLTGEQASEAFYRAPDEQLDQSAAYRLMAPIFGEGLVFDAPIDRKNEQLRMLMPSLRFDAMRNHSAKIVDEVRGMSAEWGDVGTFELVDFMKELTIRTASHCLLGREFRYEISEEFASIYHDLEQGVHPLAYHYPNFPIPTFRRRDKARVRLQELVSGIIAKRRQQTDKPTDMFQSLMENSYEDGSKLTDNEITGMLIGAVFAGHHTSSGTAAWVLLELLKQPELMREVRDELDAIYGEDGEVTFQSLRQIPKLEAVVKEVLRLHPPLIVLMREVSQDLRVGDYLIPKGRMVWASPPVTHRIASLFPDPQRFDPTRYSPERAEDKNLNAYQPFGGGRHKCSGNAFAIFQIKAIFAVMLREWDFELVNAPDTYVDDYTQMIVQPLSPCPVRFKRRLRKTRAPALSDVSAAETPANQVAVDAEAPVTRYRAVIDLELCQGHSMCVGEAPEIFAFDGMQARVADGGFDVGLLDAAERAVEHCPNRAIHLEPMR
ncbi:MAG: cytochrome P450 [Polyangiales bacterium]|nr:cytochrome P450 [Sandaracinaceae bacterium]